MSSKHFLDRGSRDKISKPNGKDGERLPESTPLRIKLKGKHKVIKVHCKAEEHSSVTEFEDGSRVPQSESSVSDQGFDEIISSSAPTLCPPPICRQFWKAGSYDLEQSAKAPVRSSDGQNHLRVHPLFLHSNATSHKWAFGAIAELLDNAIDEIQNGATFVLIDKISNPLDGSPCLLVKDDGGGMDPEAIRRCMSFGFSDKQLKSGIGKYGNGFKTSSMRLGADVVMFSCHSKKRTRTRSVGLLSYTFLRQTGHDRIVVPMVDYEFDASKEKFNSMLTYGSEHFSSNLSVLLQWSPYSTEEILLKQFDDMGNHGTKIVIYNLWQNGDGDMELDFSFDNEDIRINIDEKLTRTKEHPNAVSDQHIANLHRYSLRVYASILYLRLPETFRIILRGRVVEHHNIANDLKFPEFILYKPQFCGKEATVVTTIGFLKDAPYVNIHGFNIYHRNRLILHGLNEKILHELKSPFRVNSYYPFWRVVKDSTNSVSRGVVGILEANFVEPTHNKQDFEKTSLFQKLEARLKDMTVEYWHYHCELIGYHPLRKLSSASVSSYKKPSSRPNNVAEEPVLIIDDSPDEEERDLRHFRPKGLKRKRKKHNLEVELETTGHPVSASCATNSLHDPVEQPPSRNGTQIHNEETAHIMQDNQKLRSQLLDLERTEEDLNLKVQQLRNELGDVEDRYARLLAQSQLLSKIKGEKSGYG